VVRRITMSKIVVENPIVHTPAITTYEIAPDTLFATLPTGSALMTILDSRYYYTDLEGWGKILGDLMFKSSLYKADKFDCENYAMKAFNLCAERHGLNTLSFVIGKSDLGRHGYNMFYHGFGWMLFEPNDGFPYAGSPFDIGEYGYFPEMVLL